MYRWRRIDRRRKHPGMDSKQAQLRFLVQEITMKNIAATASPASAGGQKYSKKPALAATTLALLLPAGASAQTAPLNDTGQTLCYDGTSTLVACTAANTGNAAPYPGQDGRFGRDAAQAAGALPAKTGGGAAGFDFTALNASGNPNSGTGAPGGHDCVKDNVTGLTWEVKQTTPNTSLRYAGHTYTWYDSTRPPGQQGSTGGNTCNATLPSNLCNTQAYVAAVNTAGLCGKNDWRLPTSQELLSIVHNGVWNPSLDTAYFPDVNSTLGSWWWRTSETYAPDPAYAWHVHFNGSSNASNKADNGSVRLVRSGQ